MVLEHRLIGRTGRTIAILTKTPKALFRLLPLAAKAPKGILHQISDLGRTVPWTPRSSHDGWSRIADSTKPADSLHPFPTFPPAFSFADRSSYRIQCICSYFFSTQEHIVNCIVDYRKFFFILSFHNRYKDCGCVSSRCLRKFIPLATSILPRS